MELKEFITQSLKDVMDGVSKAQKELKGGEIIPSLGLLKGSSILLNKDLRETHLSGYQIIDFEIFVNVVEGKGGGKLNVSVGGTGIGVSGGKSNSVGHTEKLSFKIPVRFPEQKPKKELSSKK